jgi:hypothetical protein
MASRLSWGKIKKIRVRDVLARTFHNQCNVAQRRVFMEHINTVKELPLKMTQRWGRGVNYTEW